MSLVRARESFFLPASGPMMFVAAGEIFDSSHSVVRRAPGMFEPVEVAAARQTEPAVEQATAAPGERRMTKRG